MEVESVVKTAAKPAQISPYFGLKRADFLLKTPHLLTISVIFHVRVGALQLPYRM